MIGIVLYFKCIFKKGAQLVRFSKKGRPTTLVRTDSSTCIDFDKQIDIATARAKTRQNKIKEKAYETREHRE